MDLWEFVIAALLLGGLGLVALYFVVKAAIKNAFIEDRAFQAKVQKQRAEKARPTAG